MKKYICSILSAILILVNIIPTMAGTVLQKGEVERYLDEVSRYEMSTVLNPSYSSAGGEWLIMGLARYGTITDEYIVVYKNNLKKHLALCNGVLSKNKYTEYARTVLALTSIEENPADFAGFNILKPLAEFDKIVSMGANEIIYALIAFDSGSYEIPEPKADYTGKKTTRERLIKAILDNQKEDGGWCLAGTKSDTDVTAMAVQALAPYCKKDKKVEDAVMRGLNRLSELQQGDGGYKSIGKENCESNAQVLTALATMNISVDDNRFVKNGNTVIDGLMKYYKGGGFSHFVSSDVNQIATEQALYALTAYYRSISGMNSLFEMCDGITKRALKLEDNKRNETVTVNNNNRSTEKNNKVNKKDKKPTGKGNVGETVKSKRSIETNTIEATSLIKYAKKETVVSEHKEEMSADNSEMVQTERKGAVENNIEKADSNRKEPAVQPVVAAVVILIIAVAGGAILKKVKKSGKAI